MEKKSAAHFDNPFSQASVEEKQRQRVLEDIRANQAKKKSLKIHKILNADERYVNLQKLRDAAWNGIPQTIPCHRCDSWKYLLDYLPIDKEFRSETLNRKREEYYQVITKYFGGFKQESVAEVLEGSSKGNKIQLSDYEKKNLK